MRSNIPYNPFCNDMQNSFTKTKILNKIKKNKGIWYYTILSSIFQNTKWMTYTKMIQTPITTRTYQSTNQRTSRSGRRPKKTRLKFKRFFWETYNVSPHATHRRTKYFWIEALKTSSSYSFQPVVGLNSFSSSPKQNHIKDDIKMFATYKWLS